MVKIIDKTEQIKEKARKKMELNVNLLSCLEDQVKVCRLEPIEKNVEICLGVLNVAILAYSESYKDVKAIVDVYEKINKKHQKEDQNDYWSFINDEYHTWMYNFNFVKKYVNTFKKLKKDLNKKGIEYFK